MTRKRLWLVILTIFALGTTLTVVPVREWGWVDRSRPAAADRSALEWIVRFSPDTRAGQRAAAALRARESTAASVDPLWPPRYAFVWATGNRRDSAQYSFGDRISWPVVFAEQALVLLVFGGLFSWTMFRSRRAPAHSREGN
jgi:hypothetical protein